MFFFMSFLVGLVFAAGVRAQTSEFPQAPAPALTMDAGAGFLVTYSGAFEFSAANRKGMGKLTDNGTVIATIAAFVPTSG
ncbi:hypothetical protein ACSQ67_022440 [Phaseolus vulgaris]